MSFVSLIGDYFLPVFGFPALLDFTPVCLSQCFPPPVLHLDLCVSASDLSPRCHISLISVQQAVSALPLSILKSSFGGFWLINEHIFDLLSAADRPAALSLLSFTSITPL